MHFNIIGYLKATSVCSSGFVICWRGHVAFFRESVSSSNIPSASKMPQDWNLEQLGEHVCQMLFIVPCAKFRASTKLHI
jgi:hypothetical protein